MRSDQRTKTRALAHVFRRRSVGRGERVAVAAGGGALINTFCYIYIYIYKWNLKKTILAKLPTTFTCDDFSMGPSVGSKCEEDRRKHKDFRCVRLLGFLRHRRKGTKSRPQYGEQNVRNFRGK